MSKEIDIVALGELLIDFTESGYSKNGMKLFEQNPGGAPADSGKPYGVQYCICWKSGK